MISDTVNRPVLLLVDQFEELFRYALDDPDKAVTFVDVLLKTAAERKKVYVAITIRTDELDKCSRYPGLTDAVNAGQFLTPALDRFQIKEAIEGPVMLFNGTVEPTLSTWLLNSLEREEDKLPLMQHALKFLFAQAAAATPEGQRITLTLAGMHALFGGQPKEQFDSRVALRQFLSDRMDRFYEELPEPLRRATPALFCALTDIDSHGHDIRQAVPLSRLQQILAIPEADVILIVDVFRRQGYLRPEPGTPLEPGTNIDVTHECVLRTWTSLRDNWLVDEQRSRDHVREFVRDAYSYEADPDGHGGIFDSHRPRPLDRRTLPPLQGLVHTHRTDRRLGGALPRYQRLHPTADPRRQGPGDRRREPVRLFRHVPQPLARLRYLARLAQCGHSGRIAHPVHRRQLRLFQLPEQGQARRLGQCGHRTRQSACHLGPQYAERADGVRRRRGRHQRARRPRRFQRCRCRPRRRRRKTASARVWRRPPIR